MQRSYFTADTHFEHGSVAQLADRPFTSMEEHDAALIDGINRVVGKKDRLYILGDFALDNPGKYRARIVCREIYFVMGNHDRHLKSQNTFGTLHHILTAKVCGMHAVLCHYPMAYWPSSHRGSAHLYGHTHANREDTLDAVFPGRRSLDVGMDNAKLLLGAYVPFSECWLYDYFQAKPGHDHTSYYDALRKERDEIHRQPHESI